MTSMKNLAAAFFLFFTSQLAGQSGTITTNMLNRQTGSPNPGYTVSAYQGDEKLGSVTADNKGVAKLDNIVLTDVVYNQRINNFSVSEVLPDESTRRPSVFVQSPKYTNVNYIVYTLPLARELSKGTIHLEYGHNQILFPEAGADGRRLIVFNGNGFGGAFKYISTDNTSISARAVSNPTNALGKLNSVDEDVRLVFEDDGYVTKDTTLTLPTGEVFNVNVDGSMDRVPNTTEADITTMSIIGENLSYFPVHLIIGDKDSIYVSNGNGLIELRHKDFNDPYIEKLEVRIDDPEDESPEDLWMGKYIMKVNSPDANMGDGEIAQNKSINWNTHEAFKANLKDINDAFYVALKFTPRFGTDAEGYQVDMKTVNISAMSNRLAAPPTYGNARWEKYNGADTLYTIIQTITEDTKETVSQDALNIAVDALTHVRGMYNNQANGSKTLNLSGIKFIETREDTFYQDIVSKGLQNVYLVQFSGGNPGNLSVKRDDDDIMRYAKISFGTGSSYNKMVSEMIAGMAGLQDGDYGVGYYFLNESTFGKIWVNYKQEHAKGEPFLKNPDL